MSKEKKAPAPSSLAGGEVREKVARIVDPETFALIAHYTGIERFDGLSPAEREPAVFKAYPDLKAARDAAYADADAILAALSPEAPAREKEDKALYLKLIDTLKPFAEVAEKLKHCHVVEICEPTPANPSRNIIPMPREWFERAADDLEVIAIQLHSDGVLSEGQAAKLTGLDRVEVRKQSDALTPRHEAPASEDEARRKLIECIDQWDSEMEYDAEDRASLADDILHAFNGPPVVSHEAPAEGAGEDFYAVGEFVGRQPVLCVHGSTDPNNLCPYCEGEKIWGGRNLRARSSAPEA